MSQRNPMNERYSTNQPQGKTRKSAAAAKPVTKAASSVRMESDASEKKGFFSRFTSNTNSTTSDKNSNTSPEAAKEAQEKAKEERKQSREERAFERKTGRARARAVRRFVPDTEEYRRLHRKRLKFSTIGLVGMIAAIILSLVIPTMQIIPLTLMIVAWLFYYVGVRIDSKELRPLREEAYKRAERKAEKQAAKDAK